MADTDCPGCGAESEHEEAGRGDVLTCIHCGYVGIWDEGWRLLRPEEHADLMGREEFLESLSFGLAFRSWRARDAVNLCAVLHSRLDRVGVHPDVIAGLRDEIMSAGYHSHPSDDDARALGLGKYGDVL